MIFERKLADNDSDNFTEPINSLNIYTGAVLSLNEIGEGEAFIDKSTLTRRIKINGKLYKEAVINGEVKFVEMKQGE